MKRYLIAAVLILAFSNSSYADELSESPVSNVQDVIFRSSLTSLIPVIATMLLMHRQAVWGFPQKRLIRIICRL